MCDIFSTFLTLSFFYSSSLPPLHPFLSLLRSHRLVTLHYHYSLSRHLPFLTVVHFCHKHTNQSFLTNLPFHQHFHLLFCLSHFDSIFHPKQLSTRMPYHSNHILLLKSKINAYWPGLRLTAASVKSCLPLA